MAAEVLDQEVEEQVTSLNLMIGSSKVVVIESVYSIQH
jgi:hypothetical protein